MWHSCCDPTQNPLSGKHAFVLHKNILTNTYCIIHTTVRVQCEILQCKWVSDLQPLLLTGRKRDNTAQPFPYLKIFHAVPTHLIELQGPVSGLNVQCVRLRGIYWQKWNIIIINMFWLVINLLQTELLCSRYLRKSHFYLQRDGILFHEVRHIAPCSYRTPEWTNQTLVLKTAFQVFYEFRLHRRFSYMLRMTGGEVEGYLITVCNLTTRCH